MSKYVKTAKDRAFDRERQRLGATINRLKEELRKANIQIDADDAMIQHRDEIIEELEKENQMLRGMVKLDKDDLDRFVYEMRQRAQNEQAVVKTVEFLKNIKNGIY